MATNLIYCCRAVIKWVSYACRNSCSYLLLLNPCHVAILCTANHVQYRYSLMPRGKLFSTTCLGLPSPTSLPFQLSCCHIFQFSSCLCSKNVKLSFRDKDNQLSLCPKTSALYFCFFFFFCFTYLCYSYHSSIKPHHHSFFACLLLIPAVYICNIIC